MISADNDVILDKMCSLQSAIGIIQYGMDLYHKHGLNNKIRELYFLLWFLLIDNKFYPSWGMSKHYDKVSDLISST